MRSSSDWHRWITTPLAGGLQSVSHLLSTWAAGEPTGASRGPIIITAGLLYVIGVALKKRSGLLSCRLVPHVLFVHRACRALTSSAVLKIGGHTAVQIWGPDWLFIWG